MQAQGNAKIDMSRLVGQKVLAFRSWGKHFLIELPEVAVRVHFLMFGSYTIDQRKDREPRLRLAFHDGEINFYNCAVRFVEGALDETYDWSADVMSDDWDAAAGPQQAPRQAKSPDLRRTPWTRRCFPGVGNIIKNEVLFRMRVHPLSEAGALPATRLRALVDDAREYTFEFLKWKRALELRKHWQVYNKSICPSCEGKLTRAVLGVTARRSFFCERCQKRYAIGGRGATARRKKA